MQHLLQVSRKVDYALRAMIHLSSLPDGAREPLHEIASRNCIPKDFLAKIVKGLADAGLVKALRGAHGGVKMAKSPALISFLDVIEAVEGPVQLNVCLDDEHATCGHAQACTMQAVWREGQERMLDVYRSTKLADLVAPARTHVPVPLGIPRKPPAVVPRA